MWQSNSLPVGDGGGNYSYNSTQHNLAYGESPQSSQQSGFQSPMNDEGYVNGSFQPDTIFLNNTAAFNYNSSQFPQGAPVGVAPSSIILRTTSRNCDVGPRTYC